MLVPVYIFLFMENLYQCESDIKLHLPSIHPAPPSGQLQNPLSSPRCANHGQSTERDSLCILRPARQCWTGAKCTTSFQRKIGVQNKNNACLWPRGLSKVSLINCLVGLNCIYCCEGIISQSIGLSQSVSCQSVTWFLKGFDQNNCIFNFMR